jgi:site-specific DNA-methyltransferase (adenine-specific)
MGSRVTKRKPRPDDLAHITEDLRGLAVHVSEVVKDPDNLRLHSARSIEGVRGSLAKFTQRKNVVVNRRTGVIEAGNGTLDALLANGREWVAVAWVDDDPVTAAAYAIADNRTAELSEWDAPNLRLKIEALDGFEVPGVDLDWLDGLGTGPEPPEPEPAPDVEPIAPPAKPRSESGQVYQLGQHRLICGDCRDPDSWQALIGAEKVNVVFTSPPYASQRKYDESSGFRPVKPEDYVEWWTPIQEHVARHLAADGSFFVNIKEHCEDGQRVLYVKDLTLAHVRLWGWRFVDEFCWTRSGVPGGWSNRFKNGWEPVFHFCRQQQIKLRAENVLRDSRWSFDYSPDNAVSGSGSGLLGSAKKNYGKADGQARPSNVLAITTGGPTVTGQHSAEFPVGLPESFVKAFSDKGDLVVDPFLGSGTTMIAAARHGRRCFGMEVSAAYCDVIRKRWGDWARSAGVEPGKDAL